MISLFEEILTNLGKDLAIELKPDHLNSCTLKIDNDFLVQLKINKEEESVLIISFLTEIPPGRFREDVFTNTLVYNNKFPKIGTFAFNSKDTTLVFFEYIKLVDTKTKNLKNILAQFIENASNWKKAIENGFAAPLEFSRSREYIKK